MAYNRATVIVHDEDAYEAGKLARIKENARKGKRARWLAEDATREDVIKFLYKAADPARGGFLFKMLESMEDWGSLTAGQEAAVRKIMAQQTERRAAYAAEASKSQFVGEIGKREMFTLTLLAIYENESNFGTQYAHKFKDEAGNLLVWKTSTRHEWNKGEAVTVKATPKSHYANKDGVKTTYITRLA